MTLFGIIAILVLSSCSQSPEQPEFTVHAQIDPGAIIRDVVVADFVAGPATDVAMILPGEVRTYRIDGTLRRTRTFPDAALGATIAHDVDTDGKPDLIIGSHGAPAVEVRVINGLLDTLTTLPIIPSIDGVTVPWRADANSVDITTYSRANSTPKIAARVSLTDGTVETLVPLGPRPTGLDRSRIDGRWLISGMGIPVEGRNAPFSYRHRYDWNSLLFVDPGSSSPDDSAIQLLLDGPVGWDTPSGDAVSYPVARLFRTASGEERIAVATNVINTLSATKPALTILDLSGREIHRHTVHGPSEADLIVLPDGSSSPLAVGWSDVGELWLVGDNGTIAARYVHPVGGGRLRLLSTAQLDDDPDPEFLIALGADLLLLEDDLSEITRYNPGHPVRGALITERTDSYVDLVVWGTHLSFLRYRPGGSVTPQDRSASVHSPREKTAVANDLWTSYDVTERVLTRHAADTERWEAASAFELDGGSVLVAGDFLSSPGIEYLLRRDGGNRLEILDPDGSEAGRILNGPEHPAYAQTIGDFDNDGYEDFALFARDPHSVTFLNAYGEVLYRQRFFYTWDTIIVMSYWDAETIVFGVNAGYRLEPRGAIVVDRTDAGDGAADDVGTAPEPIRILGGASALPLKTVMVSDSHILIPSFTAHNGARYDHGPFGVETDTELALKVFDRDTYELTSIIRSRSPTASDHGYLIPFSLVTADGDRRFYATEAKFRGYYPGTPLIYRLDPLSWELEVRAEGPEDSTVYIPQAGRYEGEEAVFVLWNAPDAIDVLAPDLQRPLRPRTEPQEVLPKGLVTVIDLDGDGTSEIVGLDGGNIQIVDDSGTVRFTFPEIEGRPAGWVIDERSSDGELGIVIWDSRRVVRYVSR